MRLQYTSRFLRMYQRLPKEIRELVDNKLRLLLENPRHPSLRMKKMKMRGAEDIYEASVTMDYRITFQIEGDLYILRKVGTHDILRKP